MPTPRAIVTLEQLKRKVSWHDIAQERHDYEVNGRNYVAQRFRLLPSDPAWPKIDLHFDERVTCLDPLGFSHWHAHYDGNSSNRRNLINALRTVRALVTRKLCLVEELQSDGKYWGGGLTEPDGIPSMIGKEITRFRRVFFDQAPTFEEIDFSRYWEGKHFFVEWREKAAVEKIWKENGMPVQW